MAAAGPKKFAEPVSLSSTDSADFPLPRTAFGFGFDLLALRARRKRQPKRWHKTDQGVCKRHGRNLRFFLLSTFPQPFIQYVETSVETAADAIQSHSDGVRYRFGNRLHVGIGAIRGEDGSYRPPARPAAQSSFYLT